MASHGTGATLPGSLVKPSIPLSPPDSTESHLMIVKPSLLDHPKFLRLQRRLGKDSLHLLIRIWAHCETDCRGEVWADKDPEYLEAVARWEGEAGFAFKAFVDAGFIAYTGGSILVHDWNEMNASLIASWTNGRTGGRPSRKTHGVTHGGVNQNQADNPSVSSKTTHGVTGEQVLDNPEVTPRVTHGFRDATSLQNGQPTEPTGNPRVPETGQIETRGTPEKRREEDTLAHASPSAFAEAPSVDEVLAMGAAFRGEIASGAPGPIDPDYCRSWWDRKDNSRNGGWSTMLDWRRALIASWRSDFRKTFWKGGSASASTSNSAERAESVPLGIRIRELEKAAEEHIGNPESTRGTLEAKAKAKPEWLKLKKLVRELRGQLVGTEVEP